MADGKYRVLPLALNRKLVIGGNVAIGLTLVVLAVFSRLSLRPTAEFVWNSVPLIPLLTTVSLMRPFAENWMLPIASVFNVAAILGISAYMLFGFVIFWPVPITVCLVAWWPLAFASAISCWVHWKIACDNLHVEA